MEAIDTLNCIKARVDTARHNVSVTEGQLMSLMERLNNEFGVSTVEDGVKLFEQMSADIAQQSINIDKRVKRLASIIGGNV